MGYKIIKKAFDYNAEERKFLMQWINGKEFFSKIRILYRKGDSCNVLENMYLKYDSRYDKTICIYRGLSFYKENEIKMKIFQRMKENLFLAYKQKELLFIDNAPSSFSRSINVAEWFLKKKEYNHASIMYHLHIREYNEIDTCSKELAKKEIYKNEKELLLATHKMKFEILHVFDKNDRIEVILKEISNGN